MSILRLRDSIQSGEDHLSACPDKRSDPPVNTASMCIPSSDQVWFHVAPIVLPNLTAKEVGEVCFAWRRTFNKPCRLTVPVEDMQRGTRPITVITAQERNLS